MTALAKIDGLQNKTLMILGKYPSLGMNFIGVSDTRITKIALDQASAFKLNLSGHDDFPGSTIILNPKKWNGFFWWKRPQMIQIPNSKIESMRKGLSTFDSKTNDLLSDI